VVTLNHAHYYDADQLYDTAQDAWEQTNLAGLPSSAEILADMKARLSRYLATFNHPFPDEPDPFFLSDGYAPLVENARHRLTVADIGYFHERYW